MDKLHSTINIAEVDNVCEFIDTKCTNMIMGKYRTQQYVYHSLRKQKTC